MKKIVLLVVAFVMGLSAMCFAAGEGAMLDRQLAVAQQVVAVLGGSGNADALKANMVPELAKNFDAAKLTADVNAKVGKLSNFGFAAWEKVALGKTKDNKIVIGWVLTEGAKATKVPSALVRMVFGDDGKKAMLLNIAVQGIQPPKDAKAPAKKAEEE